MAKVLISYFSTYGDHSYLSIRDELIKNGNDVYLINWNNYIKTTKEWGNTKIKKEYHHLILEIIKFSPDLVLNFCFCLPVNILEKLSCPIVIIDADNPQSFWNKEYFKIFSKKNNCYFWGLESSSLNKLEKFLGTRIDKSKYMYAPMATSMQREIINYKRNICFLGSAWLRFAEIPSDEKYHFIEFCYKNYLSDFMFDYEKLLEQYNTVHNIKNKKNKFSKSKNFIQFLYWHFAGQERLQSLSVLSDLGLEVYGNTWKRLAAPYNMEVAICGHDGLISEYEQIKELYNSSKISVNFSNPQAPTGVSWRVFDIMASNSCLLVEDKPDWREYFEQYLKKETIDAVIYKDRYDMRNKAINLLNDEELRLRCVADLNNAIEKNGRWIHRFQILEKLLNIKIISNNNSKGQEIINIIRTNKIKKQNGYKLNKHFKRLVAHLKSALSIPIELCSVIYYLLFLLKKEEKDD